MKRVCTLLFPFLLLAAAGCSSAEPLEERIRELNWQLDASEQAAEQSSVDKRLAQRELELARNNGKVLQEKLALAYDALREARTRLDESLKDRLTQLSEAQPGKKLEISQYGGVVLESGILFKPGQHELTGPGKQAIEPLVQKLKEKEYDDYEIELAGHTDSDPIRRTKSRYRDNWDLGAMRANSVRLYLIEQGIATERLQLSSWGHHHPIEPGNKARNRRVEIMLHKQGKEASLPASAPKAAGGQAAAQAQPAEGGEAK
ncbi:MAG: OmpA family protein [Planctomycetota bacterium]